MRTVLDDPVSIFEPTEARTNSRPKRRVVTVFSMYVTNAWTRTAVIEGVRNCWIRLILLRREKYCWYSYTEVRGKKREVKIT